MVIGVGAVGEKLAGALRADRAEPDHVPAAEDAFEDGVPRRSSRSSRLGVDEREALDVRAERAELLLEGPSDAGDTRARADVGDDLHDVGHVLRPFAASNHHMRPEFSSVGVMR